LDGGTLVDIQVVFNNFSSGETSPLLAGAVDSAAYNTGCKSLKNMIPMVTGGLRKRPGTRFVGFTRGGGAEEARVIPYYASGGGYILLEFTQGRISFRGPDWEPLFFVQNQIEFAPMLSGAARVLGGLPGALEAAKEDSDLLKETADAKIAEYDAILAEQGEPDTSGDSGGDGAEAGPDDSGDPEEDYGAGREMLLRLSGALQSFSAALAAAADQVSGAAEAVSAALGSADNESALGLAETAKQALTGALSGVTEARDALAASEEDTGGFIPPDADFNAGFASLLEAAADGITGPLSRARDFLADAINAINTSPFSGVATDIAHIENIRFAQSGADVVIAGAGIDAHLLNFVLPGNKFYYRPVDVNGETRFKACAFYAGRLFLAGSETYPARVWGSKAPDSASGTYRYEDFTPYTEDDDGNKTPYPADGIVLDENDMYGGVIQWIAAGQRFLAGTSRSTWADTGEVPTPESFDMNVVEYAGASGLQAKGTRGSVVYASLDRRSLRALVYQATTAGQGFADVDISRPAAHLLQAGVRDFDAAGEPFPVLWAVLEDGSVVSVTLDIYAGITAFARHSFGGAARYVCAAHGESGDEVFFVVKRGAKHCVEKLALEDLAAGGQGVYVDGAVVTENPAGTSTALGLAHLAGEEAAALIDGAKGGKALVSPDGTAAFESSGKKIIAGTAIESEVIPNRPDLRSDKGTSIGKKRRVDNIILRLYKSFGGKAGNARGPAAEIPYMKYGPVFGYALGGAPEPFTGDIAVALSGNIDAEGEVCVSHSEPLPFTLLALVERIAVMEV
jgi:hypothetical protein